MMLMIYGAVREHLSLLDRAFKNESRAYMPDQATIISDSAPIAEGQPANT